MNEPLDALNTLPWLLFMLGDDMFVSRLVIRNFRGIAFADIRFEKGVNVLVGRNGSGKSTVLFALRLLFDENLSARDRELDETDFHAKDSFSTPANVVVAAQISGFEDTRIDMIRRVDFMVDDDTPGWIIYRYRPEEPARVEIGDGTRTLGSLSRADYGFERYIRSKADPLTLEWDDKTSGDPFTDRGVDGLFIAYIPDLRDVVSAMKRDNTSPLAKLINMYEYSDVDRGSVEQAYLAAQKVVESVPALSQLAGAVRDTYMGLAQEIDYEMQLGLTSPSFTAVLRELGILLSDELVNKMELKRNGLGSNNLLFIAILLETFRHNSAKKMTQPVLLFEEPEAHLHPQAQLGLIESLKNQAFQTILTTHSPYVATTAGISAVINLDRDDAVKGFNIARSLAFSADQISDIDRFLSVDRGSMLFAKVVILVEGPSEQILIPAFAEVLGFALSRRGIQVCAINGAHFQLYERLLGPDGLNRRVIAIMDGDEQNGPDGTRIEVLDDGTDVKTIARRFKTRTTLEYALTQVANLEAIAATLATFGLVKVPRELRASLAAGEEVTGAQQASVLGAVASIGKARFAQAFAGTVLQNRLAPPGYIEDAINTAIALCSPPEQLAVAGGIDGA